MNAPWGNTAWEGAISERVAGHERRLDDHSSSIAEHAKQLVCIWRKLDRVEIRLALAAGVGSVLGGTVVAIVIQVLFR